MELTEIDTIKMTKDRTCKVFPIKTAIDSHQHHLTPVKTTRIIQFMQSYVD